MTNEFVDIFINIAFGTAIGSIIRKSYDDDDWQTISLALVAIAAFVVKIIMYEI